jgi:hypothetical protein
MTSNRFMIGFLSRVPPGLNLHIRMQHRHHQRDLIVRGSIRINEEMTIHTTYAFASVTTISMLCRLQAAASKSWYGFTAGTSQMFSVMYSTASTRKPSR